MIRQIVDRLGIELNRTIAHNEIRPTCVVRLEPARRVPIAEIVAVTLVVRYTLLAARIEIDTCRSGCPLSVRVVPSTTATMVIMAGWQDLSC